MGQQTRKSIIASLITDSSGDRSIIANTVNETCRKIEQMPSLLKGAMAILQSLFALHALARQGKFFHLQMMDQRLRQIELWRKSPIHVFKEFILFHEKLTFFIYFSKRHS